MHLTHRLRSSLRKFGARVRAVRSGRPQKTRRDSGHVDTSLHLSPSAGARVVHQGAWSFVPEEIDTTSLAVLQHERLSPIAETDAPIVDELVRTRGETVWHHPLFAPIGITQEEFAQQPASSRCDPEWTRRTRVSGIVPVYVRGDVRSPNHDTIHLGTWHRAYLNG